jgi:hypothetical protein
MNIIINIIANTIIIIIKVAEMLARDLHGKIKLEDAGFDWKVLGIEY